MKNLVLIGLSGCGKSTFGRRLSRRLHMPLFDTDVMIEKKTGRIIADIFAEDGEAAFRDMESACAREAAAMEGVIISTGGGMILREKNMEELSRNGLVVFIDRHPSHILRSTTLGDRPLVQNDRDRLFRLYAERIALYRRHADITVPNHGGPRTLKRRILQILRRFRHETKTELS